MIGAICAMFSQSPDRFSGLEGIYARFDITLTDDGAKAIKPVMRNLIDQSHAGRPYGMRLDYIDLGLVGIHRQGLDAEISIGGPYVLNMSVRPYDYDEALHMIEKHYNLKPKLCINSPYAIQLKTTYETAVTKVLKEDMEAVRQAEKTATPD